MSLNKVQLAEAFDVSTNTIDSWARKGCPYTGKGRNGKSYSFDIKKVLEWRTYQLIKETSSESKGVTIMEANRRKAVADACLRELKLKVTEGEYVHAETAGKVWEKHILDSRAKLLSMSTKLSPQLLGLKTIPEIKERIDDAVNEALRELSGTRPTGKVNRGKSKAVDPSAKAKHKPVGRSKQKT